MTGQKVTQSNVITAAFAKLTRPRPSLDLLDEPTDRFEPSVELDEWARAVFIDDGAILANEDHRHLRFASIGFLWTNVRNARQQRAIIGQAEIGRPQSTMGKWAKARATIQITQWFGSVPDFIMTLDAYYANSCSDAEFCALVEHELYHMGQAKDVSGQARFTKSGLPVWAMRGHDVEEFIGIVRRYGADAAHVRDLVDAANRPPEIATANIARVCGTCQAKAA